MHRWLPAVGIALFACAPVSDGSDAIRQIEQRRQSLEGSGVALADSLATILSASVIVERPGPLAVSSVEALAVWVAWRRLNPEAVRRPDRITADASLGLEVGSIVAPGTSSSPEGLTYVTHWARDASDAWRVTYDAVIDRAGRPASTSSNGSAQLPADTLDDAARTISVEAAIAAARRGDYQVAATIRQAGRSAEPRPMVGSGS